MPAPLSIESAIAEAFDGRCPPLDGEAIVLAAEVAKKYYAGILRERAAVLLMGAGPEEAFASGYVGSLSLAIQHGIESA